MSPANSDSLTSFPIWLSFIAFYQLIAMAWTSNTRLKKTAVSNHPTFVSDLRKKASASHC